MPLVSLTRLFGCNTANSSALSKAAMASSQVATATLPSADRAASSASRKHVSDALTEEERFELEQCQRIIQFRDEVFAGKHPRVKLPAHLATKLAASVNKSSPPTLLPASQVYKNLNQRARQTNHQAVAADAAHTAPASAPADASLAKSSPKAFATGRTEIDPVLLEKSDHLIRAELALQRQKLERALREEGDQRRVGGNGEPPKELDVSNILAQAMTLVQATTSPSGTGAVETANAAAEKESSFDENDYYSSNHETLDSHDSPGSVGQAGPSDAGIRDARAGLTHVVPIRREATPPESRPVQPPTDMRAGAQLETQPQPPLQPRPTYPTAASSLLSRPPSVGTNDNPPDDTTTHSGSAAQRSAQLQSLRNSLASGDATRSDTSVRMEAQGGPDTSPGQWLSRESGYAAPEQRGPPGLSLSQNAAPIPAPVARASPLMTGARQRDPQVAAPMDWNAPRGAPAQVAALRGGHQPPSSPESSSPRGKAPENKKAKKKNKRKADRLAQDAATPYIKPEPRSPSPLSAPAQIRPAKRQKQAQRADEGAAYEQPQPRGPIRPDFYHLSGPQPVERPPPVSYRRYATGAPESSSAYGGQGYERVYHDDAQPSMQPLPRGHYAPHPPSPRGYPVQYPGEEYGPTRSVSHREPARYYQDEYARPEPEPVMAGSQRPLTRVVVDAFGREYYEPHYPHPPPMRQSVAPSARPGEPEVIYEGAAPIRHSVAPPMRPRDPDLLYDRPAPTPALSRRPPGPESYEEGGMVYRRPSPPPYAPPRRVVTQPEYGPPDPMGYPRSYSVRPMAPPGDEYAHTPERRPVEAVPRQYSMRSASARPLEPVRYDMADGSGHMPGRPEAPPDYGMPRPQSRVDMMGPPVARDFAPRPVDAPGVPRAYSTRPVGRYYGEPPPPVGEEVAYVEGPPQHGVVYEPRDVYR